MSESTAREARRDLRRTVGLSALETLRGQEQSIASVAASVNSLRNDVIALARDHATFKKDSAFMEGCHDARLANLHERVERYEHMTFWGRLRWLVTGR